MFIEYHSVADPRSIGHYYNVGWSDRLKTSFELNPVTKGKQDWTHHRENWHQKRLLKCTQNCI